MRLWPKGCNFGLHELASNAHIGAQRLPTDGGMMFDSEQSRSSAASLASRALKLFVRFIGRSRHAITLLITEMKSTILSKLRIVRNLYKLFTCKYPENS